MFANKKFYFRPVLDDQEEPIPAYYRCRCSVVRQQAPRTGWSNLAQHVKTQHLDYADCSPSRYRYTNLERISQETLYHGLESVMRHVEVAIKPDMPKRYGLITDGWSFNSEHYLAVFGCFEMAGTAQYPLPAMAPLMNSPTNDLSAATHLTFLREMLMRDYNKRVEDYLFTVGDNCYTNQCLANLLCVPLVGCATHHLNLAVQNFFREVSDDLDKVKSLMVKLKSLYQSSTLRFKTPLRPVLSQDTRWSSTFCMIHRFFRLLEFIIDDDELADNLPGPATNRRLRKLLEDLSVVKSVSKELQASTVSLLDVRVYFDRLLESLPPLASHIDARAAIVHSPHCEAAYVKVLDGKTAELTRAETASLRRFAVQCEETSVAAAVDDAESSFVEKVKKRRKLATSGPPSTS
ncbi:hypothetical protein PPTG_08830 [Phytophthora nicotianae INRA-310]|uniref:BED-type domain-containing protein n=1 Tax=Phytophthora nicotianae (strain INRA-310) TaxID=761204 RepID=W2QKN1_PHYN3|nr:hypothetical protein PPTG_08830 [Phytophthora nicotianae INRA-310]ETN12780.1 hypothetical protein PPTG_08830 [Phytophthora nicotianae INRA-310]